MTALKLFVWGIICSMLWPALLVSTELHSLFNDANHYWDFDHPEVEGNISSQNGNVTFQVSGDVTATRSPTGTGLRVTGSGEIRLEPCFGLGCPVDPTNCTTGFTVSIYIKVSGAESEVDDYKFLFGNIDVHNFHQITNYKGFVIGVKDRKFVIFVVSDKYTCNSLGFPMKRNKWSHLAFRWKESVSPLDRLRVFKDGKKLPNTQVYCFPSPGNKTLLRQTITLGSSTQQPLFTIEVDNLAIWYKNLADNRLRAPWEYMTEESWIPIDANLNVVLLNLPWDPNLSVTESNEHKDLIEQFKNQMTNLNDSVGGNILKAEISGFGQLDDANVTATMYFTFFRSNWETLLQLQETFENGTLFNSSIEILNCSATDDHFCLVPRITAIERGEGHLRLYFRHLQISETGLMYGYTVIGRELGTFTWKSSTSLKEITPVSDADIGYLKPFTNYSVRVFPFSFLGYRLGSVIRIGRTRESGPSAAPNITKLYNTSSTSLFVSWLHDIPPESYNGILVGYQVTWSEQPGSFNQKSRDVGMEVDSYNITGLRAYRLYKVQVAGRTNGGPGITNHRQARTDEDAPSAGPDGLTVSAASSSSLSVQWNQVNLCCRNGITKGYQMLLTDQDQMINRVIVNETVFSFGFHNLLPYYAYNVSVRAFNVKGMGPASTNLSLTGEEAPVKPPNASVLFIAATSISIQWTFNNSVRNVLGVLLGFKVHYTAEESYNDSLFHTVGANESSLTLVNLKPFTAYHVTVGAFTMEGETKSGPVIVCTQEDVPGAAPVNVLVYNESSTEITVQWGPIPVDVRNGIILGYHVIVMLNSTLERNLTASPDKRELLVTKLAVNTTYKVSVAGFTTKGIGAQSIPVFVTTDDGDLDECQNASGHCHFAADCINTPGSFSCTCWNGFQGNGFVCSDVDECTSNPDSCPYGEICINGEGSFFCLNTTNDEDSSSCVFGSDSKILKIDKNVNTTTKLTKVARYLFNTEVKTNCSSLNFEWRVSNVTTLPFSVGTAHSVTVGLDAEWADFSSLGIGIFLVKFIARFQDFYFLDYGFIDVVPSAPFAFIAGGPEVLRKHNSNISLDGSPSRDLDVVPGNYGGMTFEWSCKRKDEMFYSESDSSNQNAARSDMSGRGCFGTNKQTLEDTGRIVLLDASAMQINQYYDIKLKVSKNDLNSSFVQRVLIVAGNPLYAEINCLMNCGSEVIPSVKVTLALNCTNPPCHKENAQLSYRWRLFREINATEESWTELHQPPTITGTELNSTYFIIFPNKLVPGRNYRLSVELENVNDETSNGFSVWLFKTSTVPSGGKCTAHESSGVAVHTSFTFNCTNWDDRNTPLRYEFVVPLADGLASILSSGYSTLAEMILPPGDPLKNYSLTIDAIVTSSTGSRSSASLTIQVLPWPLMNTPEASGEIHRLLEGPFVMHVGRGDVTRATQLATAVLQSLELQKSDAMSSEERTQIKSFIIMTLSKIKVGDLRKLIQLSSVISLAMDNPMEITPDALDLIMEMLQDMTNLLGDISARGHAIDVPHSQMAEKNLVFTIGKQLQALSSDGGAREGSGALNITTSLQIVRRVLQTVVKRNVMGEDPAVIRTGALEAQVVRKHPEQVAGSSLTLETGYVQLPDSQDLREMLADIGDYVDVEVISSRVNYYNWDSSSAFIMSHILEVDLRSDSGEILKVQNLTKDIQLGIQLHDESPKNESVSDHENTFFVTPGRIQYHKINVGRERKSYLITISSNESLNILVKYGNKPTVEDHDKIFTIPDLSSCSRNLTVEEEDEEFNCTRHPNELLLTSEVLRKTGVYYVGIVFNERSFPGNNFHRTKRSCFSTYRQKRSCVETKDPPPPLGVYEHGTIPAYDPRVDLNYTLDTDELSCRFWSPEKQTWLTEGCKVGPQSNKHHLLCLCNHLTSFGGGLLVAPNPIDMDTVFKELSRLDETGNFGVLLTIIFAFLLYCIAIVFAKRADRKDQDKRGSWILLKTEEDLLSHQYELIVSTGVWPDSGTTAKVTMMLYGSHGDSGPITVRGDLFPPRALLSRGSVDKYVISLSASLGTLSHAYVWHDNSGESPSWFLDYIVVREQKTSKEWKLLCNQWFSPDKDDGKIVRKLLVETTVSLPEFQEAFRSTLSGTLYERHIWMSSVTKRPGSSFTRAQRVTCCLCVIFTAMLANAMFFNLSGEPPGSTIQIGPLKMSMRQIIITMQSCLIIAPINYFIVAIFKNSRATFDKYCCKRPSRMEDHGSVEDDDRDKPLHHIFVYVAWILCFATAVTSATVVFFYSLMWGKETADEWLSSILLSITMDILAIQPVRLVVLAAIAAIVITKAKRTKAKLSSKTRNTSIAWEDKENDEPPDICRGAVPDATQLEWYKKYRDNETKTLFAFKSLTFFLSFLFILGILCYGNRDYHEYLIAREVEAIFPRSEKVRDALGLWTWMMNIFSPAIYATNWYNGDEDDKKIYISDKSSVLIGMPRIRQLRIEMESCPKRLEETYNITEVCYRHYAICCEDNTPMYLPKWKLPPPDVSPSSFKKLCPKPWRYQSSDELNNLPKVTPRATYGGGGYVADLGYGLRTARRVMEELSKNQWIDRRTRAAVVEFNIFNGNINILAVAHYFFEFLPTGGVFRYITIETLDLYGTGSSLGLFILLCRLVLMVMIAVCSGVELVKIWRHRRSYFRNISNWLILALIITCIAAVVLHIFREKATKDTIKELQENIYTIVSFHKPLSLLDFETATLSVVTFLATVKLLSLLRFSKQAIFLSITIRFAGKYLLSFSFVFIIIFCSFAVSGMMAFGGVVESYSSILKACVSQFEFLLGKAVPNFQMAKVNPLLAFMFSSLYICSMTVFFLNFFIVILNCALEEVKYNLDTVEDELNLADFMIAYLTQGISNIFGRKKRKNHKLYCENMTFEEECAYVENSLVEIDRRLSMFTEHASIADCFRLKKDHLRNTFLYKAQLPLISTKPVVSSRSPSSQREEKEVMTEEETLDNSENEVVTEDFSNPSYSVVKGTVKNYEQMANQPISPSEIIVNTECGENQISNQLCSLDV